MPGPGLDELDFVTTVGLSDIDDNEPDGNCNDDYDDFNPGEAKHSSANAALRQKRPRATCSPAPPCFKGGDDYDDGGDDD